MDILDFGVTTLEIGLVETTILTGLGIGGMFHCRKEDDVGKLALIHGLTLGVAVGASIASLVMCDMVTG